MMRLAAGCALAFGLAAASCSGGGTSPRATPSPDPRPSATATTELTPPPAAAQELTLSESGQKLPPPRWNWDTGLFNVAIWVRADDRSVAVTYGGLYEGPGNFSLRPGGIALLDAATGTPSWRIDTVSQAFPAALREDAVVFGTADGTVFALDRTTGAERWRLEFPGIPFQVGNAGDVIIVSDADPETWGPGGLVDKTRLGGRVWALDPEDGGKLWDATVGSFNAYIATDGELVVASSSSPRIDGQTVAFEALTGKERWRVDEESSSPPAIGDGLVLLPGGTLRALDADTGRPVWSVSPRAGGTFFSPAFVQGAVVSSSNTHSTEVLDVDDGSTLAVAETGECGSQWLEGGPRGFGLFCHSLVELQRQGSNWKLTVLLTPQGGIDSAARSVPGVVFSTGIGSAPDRVIALDP